jgi:predicted Zn-dependent peptidase
MKRSLLAFLLCAGGAAQVKLPPYTREVLPNGTVLYMMPRAGLPLVNFRILVRGGTESETAPLAGLAGMTATLLRQGTARWTAPQFSEDLDGLGGTFGATADAEVTMISAEFLQKDFDKGLDLVADAVLHPAFPEAEVRKAMARRMDGLKTSKDNPGAAITNYLHSYFFGADHPYGHIPDEASLDHIRRNDMVDYHKRMYVGRNFIVIVAGAFDPAAARARLTETIGAAPAGAAYAWAQDHPPAANPAPRVLLVDKPDATQTYFIIAQRGAPHASPDRVPLMLVNTLFGGRFTSMINDELRVNSGLTYGANSRLENARMTGALYITSYTRTDTTEKAIDLALDVLKRLRTKGITAEQLASAKAYTKGTYPSRTLQTGEQIATVLGDMEIYGLDRNEVDQFFARVDAVTLEQANAVIQKYYGTENLTFVLLGNASKIREVAAKYGKVVEKAAKQPGWASN